MSREYDSGHSDPHKAGPIVVTLGETGLAVTWLGADKPMLTLRPRDLVDLAQVTHNESDLAWLRGEAESALLTLRTVVAEIEALRDELRATMKVVAP